MKLSIERNNDNGSGEAMAALPDGENFHTAGKQVAKVMTITSRLSLRLKITIISLFSSIALT